MFIAFNRKTSEARSFETKDSAERYCAFRDGWEIIDTDAVPVAIPAKQETPPPERLYFVGSKADTNNGLVSQTGFSGFFVDEQKAIQTKRELIARDGRAYYVYVCTPWQEGIGKRVGEENARRDLEATRRQIAEHAHEMKSIANRLGSELTEKLDSLSTWATEN